MAILPARANTPLRDGLYLANYQHFSLLLADYHITPPYRHANIYFGFTHAYWLPRKIFGDARLNSALAHDDLAFWREHARGAIGDREHYTYFDDIYFAS